MFDTILTGLRVPRPAEPAATPILDHQPDGSLDVHFTLIRILRAKKAFHFDQIQNTLIIFTISSHCIKIKTNRNRHFPILSNLKPIDK